MEITLKSSLREAINTVATCREVVAAHEQSLVTAREQLLRAMGSQVALSKLYLHLQDYPEGTTIQELWDRNDNDLREDPNDSISIDNESVDGSAEYNPYSRD